MITGVLLCPKVDAMLAAQNGSNMRSIPLITASQPRGPQLCIHRIAESPVNHCMKSSPQIAKGMHRRIARIMDVQSRRIRGDHSAFAGGSGA